MPPTTSSRIVNQPDGTFGGFYTVNGREFWIGFFKDARLAQAALNALIASANARG